MRLAVAVLVVGVAAPVRAAAPRGEVLAFELSSSQIFPGTSRAYSVYVPAQYQPAAPAAVFVGQDGLPAGVPAVFDELIHAGQIPTTIAIFVASGRLGATPAAAQRSLEHDSVGDAYARFLLEELLPDVERRQASDGRSLRLSRTDRAIGGEGSGAVAAFTAALERPHELGRVLAIAGAFEGGRGADRYPGLVRKLEPRPLRVFLHNGRGDGPDGDRCLATQALHAALVYAGQDARLEPGACGGRTSPSPAVFAAVLRRGLRWLWRDRVLPAPRSRNPLLREILIPGEDWQLVGEGYRFTEGPAVNPRGEVFFNDIPNAKTYRVGLDGRVELFVQDSGKANGQAFGPDGRLYAMTGGAGQVVAYGEDGRRSDIASGFSGNDLEVAHDGSIYVTNPPDRANPTAESKLWLIRGGDKRVVDAGLRYANGLAFSPDQRALYVSDHRSRWLYRFDRGADGSLSNKHRFCPLHLLDTADDTSGDGMHVDHHGRIYVATRTGLLQICDDTGRLLAVLATPNRRISNVTLGGPRFDTLFATAGDRVWKRRLATRGANAWAPPRPAQASRQE